MSNLLQRYHDVLNEEERERVLPLQMWRRLIPANQEQYERLRDWWTLDYVPAWCALVPEMAYSDANSFLRGCVAQTENAMGDTRERYRVCYNNAWDAATAGTIRTGRNTCLVLFEERNDVAAWRLGQRVWAGALIAAVRAAFASPGREAYAARERLQPTVNAMQLSFSKLLLELVEV
jgi:hypothetical protein